MWLASWTSAKEHEETGHYHSHNGCGQRHHSKRNDPREKADEKKTSDHKLPFTLFSYPPPRHHAIMLHGSAMFG